MNKYIIISVVCKMETEPENLWEKINTVNQKYGCTDI